MTAFSRSLGGEMTSLDRTETSLNEALADDPNDTTSPTPMANHLNFLVFANGFHCRLAPNSRD
jgi:beta-lactamase class A